MNRLIHKIRVCVRKKIIAKEFSTNATSFSGSTQNEGNKKLVELSLQAFTSSIMPTVGVYYLYTVLKDDTDKK